MKLHILFGQRKCLYLGQYAPEAIAITDEYAFEDNPDYILNAADENRASGDFSSVAILTVEVDDDAINARLNPLKPEAVKGVVVEAK